MTHTTSDRHDPALEPVDLEVLAAHALGLGRKLAVAARASGAGGSSQAAGFVERALAGLGERRAFDRRDLGGLVEARRLVTSDLEAETVGTGRRVVGRDQDDHGTTFAVTTDVTVHTDRGEQLREVLRLMDRFEEARDEVLDRVSAHHALMRLMSG